MLPKAWKSSMAETGKLYTLKREFGIVAYNISDHYDIKLRTKSQLLGSETFEIPFMVLEEYFDKREDNYWVNILINDQTGWICIEPDQLRIFKPYR